MQENRIIELKKQGTLELLVLSILTLGIYSAHYIKEQTPKIDALSHNKLNIGNAYVELLLYLSYISLGTFIFSLVSPENMMLNLVDSLLSFLVSLLSLIWGFKARNRVNAAFDFHKGSDNWIHGIWTLIFSQFYFNYKVNSIIESYESNQAIK